MRSPVRVGKPRQRNAGAQHQQRDIGHGLLAHDHEPVDRGEGEEAGNFAHALRKADIGAGEPRGILREVVEERHPAGIAEHVHEGEDHQEGHGFLQGLPETRTRHFNGGDRHPSFSR